MMVRHPSRANPAVALLSDNAPCSWHSEVVIGRRRAHSLRVRAGAPAVPTRRRSAGCGAGSDFSWQAVAAYGWDFARYNGVTFSGVLGYRALYVDYAQGSGRQRYEFDMLQHGPVVGISMRF